jgi:hypothetical protein
MKTKKTFGTDIDIHAKVMDSLFDSIEKSEAKNTWVTMIYGSGQKLPKRRKKESHSHKKAYSGPINTLSTRLKSLFTSKNTGQIPGIFANEKIVTMGQIRALAQPMLNDFAEQLIKKTKGDRQKSFKWTFLSHSRGGAITNYLLNGNRKTILFSNGDSVTLEKTGLESKSNIHTATIKIKGEALPYTVPVETSKIGFSSTAGPTLKSEKELTHVRTDNLEFLATGDGKRTWSKSFPIISALKNLGQYIYGMGMKPFNQRHISNPGKNLLLHIPVNHSAITKADPKRILHAEIEILLSYLKMKENGHEIDPRQLKIPLRNKKKWYQRGKSTSKLIDVEVSPVKILSAGTCTVPEIIAALREKYNQMKKDSAYKKDATYINIHGDTDRRFLVMRSACYETAFEERLALAEQEKTDDAAALHLLFAGDTSKEVKEYTAFMQNCLSKNGLDDPLLLNLDNKNNFLLLKTAALIKDREFVENLFTKIDTSCGKDIQTAIARKDDILKFLEHQDVTKNATQLKSLLIKHQEFLTSPPPKTKRRHSSPDLTKDHSKTSTIQSRPRAYSQPHPEKTPSPSTTTPTL